MKNKDVLRRVEELVGPHDERGLEIISGIAEMLQSFKPESNKAPGDALIEDEEDRKW